ncbi:dihydrofolate reductase [Myxococcota bacterium]
MNRVKMTEIVLIAAVAQNGVIGRQNEIPWRVSEDLRRFKGLTWGYPCIMGRATYESLPPGSRPLPGRENLVLSRNPSYRRAGVAVWPDFFQAVAYVRGLGAARAFILGGATIYRLGLEVADALELTRLGRAYAGDALFPDVEWGEWILIADERHEGLDSVSEERVEYSFSTYRRKRLSAGLQSDAALPRTDGLG